MAEGTETRMSERRNNTMKIALASLLAIVAAGCRKPEIPCSVAQQNWPALVQNGDRAFLVRIDEAGIVTLCQPSYNKDALGFPCWRVVSTEHIAGKMTGKSFRESSALVELGCIYVPGGTDIVGVRIYRGDDGVCHLSPSGDSQ